MNILNRISRLLKADIHGILDNLEQAEMVLQQSIREMQSEINKDELILAELSTQQTQLAQKQQDLKEDIEALQQQLQFCLAENNELLAKSTIRKKLQTELNLQTLSKQLITIEQEKKAKQAETAEHQEKLQSIRDKLDCCNTKITPEETDSTKQQSTNISQDEIDIAFLYAQKNHLKQGEN